VARDYRNWFLPIIAFFAVVTEFFGKCFVFQNQLIRTFIMQSVIDFKNKLFHRIIPNLVLSIYATIGIIFFVVAFRCRIAL
jgi:hypothetical protein